MPGRRERKKSATRRALSEASLALFAERGYEAVTVNEIAERADVDVSTFFRLFGTKENVLFADGEEMTEAINGALAQRPPDERLSESLSAAMEDVLGMLDENATLETLRMSLCAESGRLRSRYLVGQDAIRAVAQEHCSRRLTGPRREERAGIAAAAFVGALDWLRRHRTTSRRSQRALLASAQEALRELDL